MRVGNGHMGGEGPADFDDNDDDDIVEVVVPTAKVAEPEADAAKPADDEIKNASNMSDIAALLREEGSNTSDADTGLNADPIPEETPSPSVVEAATNASSSTATPDVSEPVAAPEVEKDDAQVVPKHTGGSSLSPEAQRKKAAEDKAAERAMSMGGGGGGGGLLSGALNTVGSITGKGLRLAGKGAMAVGGQRFADRFLMQNDPMHIANGLFRARYRGMNEGIRGIDAALTERNRNIDAFNGAVERSSQGKALKEMATRENASFGDYLSGLEKGTVTSPEAQALYKNLQRDPSVHQLALSISSADKRLGDAAKKTEANYTQLVANHSDKINPVAEENRILEKLSKAGDKKPLSLETQGSDSDDAPTTGNSKEARKKFDEMLEKMKEAISAILRKIASAFGMK